ncbi:MAG: hypothetical protein RIS47_1226 [Bacteroidota bacterium]
MNFFVKKSRVVFAKNGSCTNQTFYKPLIHLDMKNFLKVSAIAIAIFVSFSNSSFAQTTDETPTENVKGPRHHQPSAEQIAAMEAQKAAMEAQKAEFKATLSDDQLAILSNTELTREQKMEALAATFTESQSAMFDAMQAAREAARENHPKHEFAGKALTDEEKAALDAKHAEVKATKDAFQASLTADQLAIMKNATLTPEEKMAALNASLTTEQAALMATLEANKPVRGEGPAQGGMIGENRRGGKGH